jgi:hypothetical protein
MGTQNNQCVLRLLWVAMTWMDRRLLKAFAVSDQVLDVMRLNEVRCDHC